MKCIIMAGGSGDSLWPISRKNYPKQFINIREGRSLIQETIVRNMSLCNEFIIVTNKAYANILEGQMKYFQGLRYRIVYEEVAAGTLAGITFACMNVNVSEMILVTSADLIIDGAGYRETVLKAKEAAKEHNVALITDSDNKNLGVFVSYVGDMLNAIRINQGEFYKQCRNSKKKKRTLAHQIYIPKVRIEALPNLNVRDDLFAKMDNIVPVQAEFDCSDIDTIYDVELQVSDAVKGNIVAENCHDVCMVNTAGRHLVVANELSDVAVVNTEDVTYISKKDSGTDIKDIIGKYHDEYKPFFDDSRMNYRPWGTHEVLASTDTYKVKRVVIYPGMSMKLHKHEHRSENWTIVSGTATVMIGDETKDYETFAKVSVPIGMAHKVMNNTDSNVVIIETGVGSIMSEQDFHMVDAGACVSHVPDIVKLEPAFKDNLWGGTKLRTVFGKNCDYDVIGESWELSAHPDGQSIIADGEYKGMMFGEFLETVGGSVQGWKCESLDRFPVLIKFIDAMQALSIQIHPDDDYAMEVEGEFGKNEMWYVVDSEPGSYLYCGLKQDATKEEIRERIENNTITDILNKIEVKPGDCVMVKAGTIHAIGAGILICEIQQNSNSTYRMYDYDRRDKFGNTRELHVDKAIDVVDTKKFVMPDFDAGVADEVAATSEFASASSSASLSEAGEGDTEVAVLDGSHYCRLLVQCKYFQCWKYDVRECARIAVDQASFASVVFLKGSGTIEVNGDVKEFKAGESFFVSAGQKMVVVRGECEAIVTRV